LIQHRLAQPGDVVAGRFVIDRIVHSGGMATVYRARDLKSEAFVALKMVQPRGLGRQHALRLRAEAEVLSSLSHPAIVRYIAHGETQTGEPYLAIDWLDGEDLARYLRHSRLTPREALRMVTRIADALAVAHARGIVHRDIKPSMVPVERN
jgi:serine/threonine protein kinase